MKDNTQVATRQELINWVKDKVKVELRKEMGLSPTGIMRTPVDKTIPHKLAEEISAFYNTPERRDKIKQEIIRGENKKKQSRKVKQTKRSVNSEASEAIKNNANSIKGWSTFVSNQKQKRS